jgi:hypothetical protein
MMSDGRMVPPHWPFLANLSVLVAKGSRAGQPVGQAARAAQAGPTKGAELATTPLEATAEQRAAGSEARRRASFRRP